MSARNPMNGNKDSNRKRPSNTKGEDASDNSPPKDIGRLIASARVRSSMTALQLSEKLGISTSYLSMIERGKKPLRRVTLQRMSEHIEIPKADFDVLWAHADRGMGKEYTNAVTDKEITDDVYKEELMFAFARLLADPEIHIKDIFDKEGESMTLISKKGKKGNFKVPISFDIKVGGKDDDWR